MDNINLLNKLLPSPFQSNTDLPKLTTESKTLATPSTFIPGYRSNFNINQQKVFYEQRKRSQQQQLNQHQVTISNHNNNNNSNGSFNKKNNDTNCNWCGLCERGFKFSSQLQKHLDEHEKCWFENCNFEGHSMLLKKHIETQHQSGLFQRNNKIETDEDIEKWREERRKRYPTKANVEARRLAQEERMKRGERLQESNKRFGDISNRKSAQQRSFKQKQQKDALLKQNHAKKKRTRRPRNRSNKNDNEKTTTNAIEEEKNCIEVNLSKNNTTITSNTMCNQALNEPQPKTNALTALIGMYGSESESESENVETDNCKRNANESIEIELPAKRPKECTSDNIIEQKIQLESENEAPDELPIIHQTDNMSPANEDDSGPTYTKTNKYPERKPIRNEKHIQKRTVFDMTRKIRSQNTLLEKLLQKEIRHERNVLLQCVRYVVENKFFGIGQNTEEINNANIN